MEDVVTQEKVLALLRNLVGNFFAFWGGRFCGKFGGNFSDPQNKRLKNFGEISEHFFVRNFVPRNTFFVPTSFCRCATLRKGLWWRQL